MYKLNGFAIGILQDVLVQMKNISKVIIGGERNSTYVEPMHKEITMI